MKFYSIKYCLTKGIDEFEGVIHAEKYASETTKGRPGIRPRFEVIGRDCFLTIEEAKDAAYAKRDADIAISLKRIDRLQALEF